MASDAFLRTVTVVATTYLLHSTLLLSGVWLLLRVTRAASLSLRERLWKWGLALPLATVLLQFAAPGGRPLMTWVIGQESRPELEVAEVAEAIASADARDSSTEDSASGRTMKASLSLVADETLDVSPALVSASGLDVAISAEAISSGEFRGAFENRTGTLDWPTGPMSPLPADPGFEGATGADDGWVVEIRPGEDSTPLEETDGQSIAGEPAVARTEIAPLQEPKPSSGDDRSVIPASLQMGGAPRSRLSLHALLTERVIPVVVLACLVVGLLRIIWERFRIWRRLRSMRPVEGIAQELLDQLLSQLRPRRPRRQVRLLESDACGEAAACGVLRGTIVLPPGLTTQLGVDELRALLAHELGHLVRRDPAWLGLGRALTLCLPWQPLNLLATRRWRSLAEQLCDNWAMHRGVSGLSLARCLTQVAEWRVEGRFCPGIPLSATSLTLRVERLLDGTDIADRWCTGWRRHLVTAATATCLAAIVWMGPRTAWTRTSAIPAEVPVLPLATTNESQHGGPQHGGSWSHREDALLTPTGSSIKAQGRDRRERTLGQNRENGANPNGVPQGEEQKGTKATEKEFAPGDKPGIASRSEVAGPASPLSEDSPEHSGEAELPAVLGDLRQALILLDESENDTEVSAAVAAIQQRLESIEARLRPPKPK